MKNYILSIYFGTHDSCLTIASDKKILLHLEGERVFRKKHIGLDGPGMLKLIQTAFDYLGISINDISKVYLDISAIRYFDVVNKRNEDEVIKLITSFKRPELENDINFAISLIKSKALENKEFLLFSKEFKPVFSTHHHNHIGVSVPSKLKNALIVCGDGGSEDGTTKVFIKNGEKIKQIDDLSTTENSGIFYCFLTQLIIDKNRTAANIMYPGKTMGLSSYGKFDQKIYNLIFENIKYFIDRDSKKISNLRKIFSLRRSYNKPWLDKKRIDLAYNGQRYFEDSFLKVFKKYSHLSTNVIFVGGCALNVLLNTKIVNSKLFKKIYIPPITNDCGQSLGAILYHHPEIECDYPFLGRSYGEIEYPNNKLIEQVTADLLDHKIIGWYQGASEIGPRALGHRSLIGLPDSNEMKYKISVKVKGREPYRPVAPIVIEEDANKYFEININSKYMTFSPLAREITKIEAPAIVHIDGSSRLQTLAKKDNPILHDIMSNLKNYGKPPILMNTSFNFNGEPIVDTPEDAISSFKKSKIDILYINGQRILK